MKLDINKLIQIYRSKYNVHQLKIVDESVDAFSKTRGSGKISPTVLLREYQWWLKYEPKRVAAGLKIYLNKQCHIDKKGEKYARGIIRLMTDKQVNDTQLYTTDELDEMILKLKNEIINSCSECNHSGYLFDDIDESIVRSCKCMIEFKKKRQKILIENKGMVY